MSVPLSGNEGIVDTPESVAQTKHVSSDGSGDAIATWVMGKVRVWENARERGYGRLWSEYWRMWRGKWAQEDQQRLSERSRLIAPAIAQAIESSVAEIEEAVFSKDIWFDIPDDLDQDQQGGALASRDNLIRDLDKTNCRDAVTEAVLNAAIFGTGIVQISTDVITDKRPTRNATTKAMEQGTAKKVVVTVEAIRPDEFIPDPAAKNIEQMLGCAVRRVKTQHSVLEKIEAGIYRKEALGEVRPHVRLANYDVDRAVDPQSIITIADTDEVNVVEYHGKIPLSLLNALTEDKTALDEVLRSVNPDREGGQVSEDGPLIEAIVTVCNDRVLLRAMANPFVMKDRSIIAFQYEKVPGRFWGRGVVEKGYNPQKALDATIRSYIDALGYVGSPMIGMDSGRMQRGFKPEIKPGKIWLTQGSPDEIIRPISIGQLDPNLFQTATEMERMVQMGTGAFDTASAIKNQSQSGANSASSNSMLMGAFVKRAKRAIFNVDRNLLTPLVTKCLWRYMQFDPVRYPEHYDFQVKTTMGIVAREVESMQLTQLMLSLPEEYHQVKLILAQGIVQNSTIANKTQILQAVNQILNPPPPTPEQQHMQKLQQEAAEAELQDKLLKSQLTIAQIRETLARAAMEGHKAGVSDQQIQIEQARLAQEWANIQNQKDQIAVSRDKLQIDHKKADAAMIAAKKKPTGGSST
jgi:hypothetical protein